MYQILFLAFFSQPALYRVLGRAFDGNTVFDFEWLGNSEPPFYDQEDLYYWSKLEAWPHEEINLAIIASVDDMHCEE